MMAQALVFVCFAVVMGLAVLWSYRTRSRKIIQAWAATHGYTVLSMNRRWFFRGPFTGCSSLNQWVYYVKVRTANGTARGAWACCGGRLFGMLSDQLDVQWEG